MHKHRNYQCYLHDCLYLRGGGELARLYGDLLFGLSVITQRGQDESWQVSALAAMIGVVSIPALVLCGWYRFYRLHKR